VQCASVPPAARLLPMRHILEPQCEGVHTPSVCLTGSSLAALATARSHVGQPSKRVDAFSGFCVLLFVVFMLVSSFRSFVPHYNKRGGQNKGFQGDFFIYFVYKSCQFL
jgi:hypothetical protein